MDASSNRCREDDEEESASGGDLKDVLHTMPDIHRYPAGTLQGPQGPLGRSLKQETARGSCCHVWPLCLSGRSRDHLRQSSLTMVKSLVMHVTVQENVSAWFTTVQCAAVLCLDQFPSPPITCRLKHQDCMFHWPLCFSSTLKL